MPRDLFGDVTRPSISIGTRKWYTVPLSLFTHSLTIGLLIAMPLLAPAVMPSVFANDDVVIIEVLPPPPPPPIRDELRAIDPPPNGAVAPVIAPTGFTPEKPDVEVGWENRQPGPSVIVGDVDATAIVAPPPAPKVPDPVRVGGAVREPQKIRHVSPVYPAIAQAARVQGVVVIEATIGADGRLINARLLRSIPLLDQAALEAVRQWEFTPTLLNGVPVPVIMTVTVNFTLK
jgi:periplasmic protein TonB